MSKTILVHRELGKLYIPKWHKGKDVNVTFACSCGGTFTWLPDRLTGGPIPCGFCGKRYEVEFKGGMKAFINYLLGLPFFA